LFCILVTVKGKGNIILYYEIPCLMIGYVYGTIVGLVIFSIFHKSETSHVPRLNVPLQKCNFSRILSEENESSRLIHEATVKFSWKKSISSLWVDHYGNSFAVDPLNNRIRYINAASGIVTTVLGTGDQLFSTSEGKGDTVPLFEPKSCIGDSESEYLFVSDRYHIWKYHISSGMVSCYAGGTQQISFTSGDGGQAISAYLNDPVGMWLTTEGVLYVAESAAGRIRAISVDGIINTAAGAGLGYGGDGEAATSSKVLLSFPRACFVDITGSLFVADSLNGRVRVVNSAGIIGTFAGGGNSQAVNVAATSYSFGIVTDVRGDDFGNILVSDSTNSNLVIVDPSGIVVTVKSFSSYEISFNGLVFPTSVVWIDSYRCVMFEISPEDAKPLVSPIFAPRSRHLLQTPVTARAILPPRLIPQISPTVQPSVVPSKNPTAVPSLTPSDLPTVPPSPSPTTCLPSLFPTRVPTQLPTISPTKSPTQNPTHYPTETPTVSPTKLPTQNPTANPSVSPTKFPTQNPTANPTVSPTKFPTQNPTANPSASPRRPPTQNPTDTPTVSPTEAPIVSPTEAPIVSPTTRSPTENPTATPLYPSVSPSEIPTYYPTSFPSVLPTEPVRVPSVYPTNEPTSLLSQPPTTCPSSVASVVPTNFPSEGPTNNSLPLSSPVLSVRPVVFPVMAPRSPTIVPVIVSQSPATLITNAPLKISVPITTSSNPPLLGTKNPSFKPTSPFLSSSGSPNVVPFTGSEKPTASPLLPSIPPSTWSPPITENLSSTPSLEPSDKPNPLGDLSPIVTGSLSPIILGDLLPVILGTSPPVIVETPVLTTLGPSSKSQFPIFMPVSLPQLPIKIPPVFGTDSAPSMSPLNAGSSSPVALVPLLPTVRNILPTSGPQLLPVLLPVSFQLPTLDTLITSAPSFSPSSLPITGSPTQTLDLPLNPTPSVLSTTSPHHITDRIEITGSIRLRSVSSFSFNKSVDVLSGALYNISGNPQNCEILSVSKAMMKTRLRFNVLKMNSLRQLNDFEISFLNSYYFSFLPSASILNVSYIAAVKTRLIKDSVENGHLQRILRNLATSHNVTAFSNVTCDVVSLASKIISSDDTSELDTSSKHKGLSVAAVAGITIGSFLVIGTFLFVLLKYLDKSFF
jgi:hypothetical protein